MDKYTVKIIKREQCANFILNIHYAKRWPSISYSFGLFLDGVLVGIVCYGTPPSATLRIGICGKENSSSVLELNRLCLKFNLKNEASFLLSKSLKLLPKNKIIISFADMSKGHVGTVYQAANFMYVGLSTKRTDWKVRGKEHLHGQTVADEFRGQKNRSLCMREKYGNDFYLEPRPRKHRYIFIIGNNNFKNYVKEKLKYEVQKYPKNNL